MRSRFAKYAPRPWLVVASGLILVGLLVLHWVYFPTYLARVTVTPSDDLVRYEFGGLQAVANQVAISRDMELRTANDLAGVLHCPATTFDSFWNLRQTPMLRDSLSRAYPGLRGQLHNAEASGQIHMFEESVEAFKARHPDEVREIEGFTRLPASVWSDFLCLGSHLEKNETHWEGERSMTRRGMEPWIGRVSASRFGSRGVRLTVVHVNPRKAEIVASAVALTVQAYKEKEIRALATARPSYQPDQPSAQTVSGGDVGSGQIHWADASPPVFTVQTASLNNLSKAERTLLVRTLLNEPLRISQWTGGNVSSGMPVARAVKHQPYKSFGFLMTRLPVLFVFAWPLAMVLQVVGRTARSVWEAWPTSSARKWAALGDEDF